MEGTSEEDCQAVKMDCEQFLELSVKLDPAVNDTKYIEMTTDTSKKCRYQTGTSFVQSSVVVEETAIQRSTA